MRGIIFGVTYEKALEQFNKIVNNYQTLYDQDVITHISVGNGLAEVTFTNGDYWRTAIASDSARGLACNIAYIDIDIDPLTIETIIKPTMKFRPFTAYDFY